MPPFEIKMLTLGLAATNCYLLADTATKQAILIDPVDDAELLYQTANDAGWNIELILATHGHFDHVLASQRLKELTNAPFWIHADCRTWLEHLPEMGLRFTGQPFPSAAEPDRWLTSAPETITVGSLQLETRYTPGHAAGHLAFYLRSAGIIFSGDALFHESIGRTDLPGGDLTLLLRSIREQLFTLPDTTQVLAGHMQPTTIGHERLHNPYLADEA